MNHSPTFPSALEMMCIIWGKNKIWPWTSFAMTAASRLTSFPQVRANITAFLHEISISNSITTFLFNTRTRSAANYDSWLQGKSSEFSEVFKVWQGGGKGPRVSRFFLQRRRGSLEQSWTAHCGIRDLCLELQLRAIAVNKVWDLTLFNKNTIVLLRL